MRTTGAGFSETGVQRSQNEDRFIVRDDLGIYAVSDGMGGRAAGHVAAQLAIDEVVRTLENEEGRIQLARAGGLDRGELTNLVERCVLQASQRVHQAARDDANCAGMGATLTLLLVAGARGAVGHVGDSRAYFVRDGGSVQLTIDHTYANDLLRSGVPAPAFGAGDLLTRAVGTRPSLEVDTVALELRPDDRFVLCSDGFSRGIPSAGWVAKNVSDGTPEARAQALIGLSRRKYKADDATVVVVHVDADDQDDRPTLDALTIVVSARLEALEAVFLFERMSLATLDRVVSASELNRFEPGTAVFRAGDSLRSLRVIIDGEAKLIPTDGAPSLLHAGSSYGASTLLRPTLAKATMLAVTPCTVLRFDREALWRLVRARPWLAVELLERLATHLSEELQQ